MEDQKIPNVIIIDDDSINNYLSETIIHLDFPEAEIHIFTDPQAGLDYLHTEYTMTTPNKTVLFLDINMPVLSGWDILEIFKNYPDTIKNQFEIYMFTSSIAFEDKQRANDNSLVSGFIEKPLSASQLEIIFKDLLIKL